MNGNAIASTAGLGDIAGGVDYDNAHRLARHLASYITDATAIRAHVRRELGRDLPLPMIVKMMEEARATPKTYRRTFAPVTNQVGRDDEYGTKRRIKDARNGSEDFARAIRDAGGWR